MRGGGRPTPIDTALFGQFTRHILAAHARHLLVISAALGGLALSIDLPPQLDQLFARHPGASLLTQAMLLAQLAALRAVDLIPRFTPLAVYLSVCWTEIELARSGERILIWNSGRSILICMVPALWFGLLVGCGQYAVDAHLRPAAMAQQIAGHLGSRGEEFDRSRITDPHWITMGQDLMRARIKFGPPVELRDFTLYRMTPSGRLREVVAGSKAVPAHGRGHWRLIGGLSWNVPPASASGTVVPTGLKAAGRAAAVSFRARDVSLEADPLWLSLWGIWAQYLDQATLKALVKNEFSSTGDFESRWVFNYANALMPIAMALLAETICILLFEYEIASIGLQLAVLLIGYAGHSLMKILLLIGERDYFPPQIATPLAPALLLCLWLILLSRAQALGPFRSVASGP